MRKLTGEKLEAELARLEGMRAYEHQYESAGIVCGIDEAGRGPLAGPVVAAVAVLIATMVMPILQITGTSMTPVVGQGEITMVVRGSNPQRGDIIAFYYNNKVLIKRVIGLPGEWVNIDENGNVYINGELLDEPYITDRALGDCSITLPYQVPDGRYFVLGDHRSTSRDSRSTLVGPVSEEQIMGRVTLRIWPLNRIGFLQ